MELSLTTGGTITLLSFKVNRFVPDSIDLTWEFEAIEAELSDAHINIYRSQSPTNDLTEYELVEEDVVLDLFFYEDTSLEGLQHGTRVWYYIIQVIDSTDPTNFIQTSYTFLNAEVPDHRFKKIYRLKKASLKKGGRDFILMKKRTWGERCEISWDPILFHSNSEVCEDCDCFGTGWEQGFFNPIEFRGMTTPNPQAKDIQIWGEFYPSDSVLTMLNRPPLEVGDVVIDPKKDLRFYIQRIRKLERLGVFIEQQAQISLIHPDDEIYDYEYKEENN